MNVNLKRLLSFLVAMALVLGMAPATGIPAITAKADETVQNPTYADNLTLDAENKAWCPGCGATVTWEAADGGQITGDGKHVYLKKDLTHGGTTTQSVAVYSDKKICLHLNGHTYNAKTIYATGTVNVYSGNGGQVKFLDGVTTGVSSGSTNEGINLYGGSYSFQKETADSYILSAAAGVIRLYGDAKVTGNFQMNKSAARIRLYDTSELRGNCNWVTTNGYVCMMEGWTGELVTDAMTTVPKGVIVSPATAALQGTVKDNAGNFYEKASASGENIMKSAPKTEYNQNLVFLEGTQKAWCPGCQKTVTWTALTGNISAGSDKHYYLEDDLNLPVGETATDTNGRIYLYSGAKVCLHLNNHTYTSEIGSQFTTGTLNVYAGGDNGKMVFNIADGFTKAYAAFRPCSGTAIVNLYGGTYTANEGRHIVHNSGTLSLYEGAKLEGAVYYNTKSGYVTLYDTSTIVGTHTYKGESYQTLLLDKTWTGTLTLTEAEAAHVYVKDTLAGTVTNAEGKAYVQAGTALVMPVETTYNQNLAFAGDTKLAYCPGCEKIVTWTAMKGFQVNGGEHAHYYLDKDYSYDGSLAQSILMYGDKENPSKLCLHLNGKTYTARNISLNEGAAVKIYGGEGGKIDFQTSFIKDGTEVAIENGFTLKNGAAGLSLYGGTYTYPKTATGYVLNATSAGTNLYGDAKLIGNANLVYGSACVYLNDTALVDGTYTYTRASETSKYPTLTLKNGWAGEGLVLDAQTVEHTTVLGTVADGVVKTPDGKDYVQNGTALELPVEAVETTYNQNLVFIEGTTDAWCPGCKDTVTWTALTGGISTGSNKHYYLAEDLTLPVGEAATDTNGRIYLYSGAKVCLHLNNHTYTSEIGSQFTTGTLNVYAGGDNGKMVFNIADGFTKAYAAFRPQSGDAKVNLYGGTYTANEGKYIAYNAGLLSLYKGAKLEGAVYYNTKSGYVTLYDTSTIVGTHTYKDESYQTLLLDKSWTGTLTLTEAEAAHVYVKDTLAGTVTNAEGKAYIQAGTALVMPVKTTYNQNLAFAGNTKLAYCPGCQKTVTWTAMTGFQVNGGDHAHYYLDKDYSYDGSLAYSIAMYGTKENPSKLCLHLNGKTYTARNISLNQGAEVKIYGGEGGKINFQTSFINKDGTEVAIENGFTLKNGAAGLSLYGGTYTYTGTGYVLNATSAGTNLYGDAKLIGDANLVYASACVYLNNTALVDGTYTYTRASETSNYPTLTLKNGWAGEGLVLDAQTVEHTKVLGTVAAGVVKTPNGESYVQIGETLQLGVPEVDKNVFDPEGNRGYAYCKHCDNIFQWLSYSELESNAPTTESHIYLSTDVTYNEGVFLNAKADVCFNLNGFNVTAESGAGAAFVATSNRMVLMNTAVKESVVTGGQPSGTSVGSYGAALTLVGSKACTEAYLYDNVRLTKLASVQTQAIVGLSYNGGKFYMKGGVIDGTGLTNSSYAVCVYVGGGSYKAEFYMEGGQIIGGEGTNTSAGGAVMVGNTGNEVAANKKSVFKMTGGTITGGTAKTGANIRANKNCATVEILGGTVTGGTATGNGGNINVSGADLTIGGDAVISNGTVKDMDNRGGGNIAFSNGTLTISGGTITGGRVLNSSGGSGGNIKLENSTSGAVNFIMTGGKVTNGYVEGVEDERSATNYGGNIRAVNPVVMSITGGEITGGTGCSAECADSYNMMITYQEDFLLANPDTAVTFGSVTMDGGLYLRNGVNNLKFTGAPKISSGIRMDQGIMADVSGLTEGAEVVFSNVGVNAPITTACDNIDAVKGYITLTNGAAVKVLNNQLVADGLAVIDGENVTFFATVAEALAAYKAGNILRLGVEELVLDGGEYIIDAAGYGVEAGAISGTGTVTLIDTANADLESFRKVTVNPAIVLTRDNVESEVRYIVVTVNGVTSAHVLDMAVDSVNLSTEKAGLAYSSTFNCDAYLAALVGNYGIIASVKDMPGAVMDSSDKRTELQNFAPGAEAQSSYITGIFKETRTDAMNAQFGKMKIYANAYIELDLDGDGVQDVLVADTANVGAQENGWSLYDVLAEIDENFDSYSDAERKAARDFYGYWEEYGMEAYKADFVNITVELDNDAGEGDAAEDENTDAEVPV